MSNSTQQSPVDTGHLRDYTALRRSVTDRKIAGVAGGLGRHLNVDPTVIRVALVVLCFFGGAGILLYAAAWLLVPEEGSTHGVVSASPATRNLVLIGAGVLAALLLVGDGWGGVGFPWPLVLIGLAVLAYLVMRERGGSTGSAPEGGTAASTAASPTGSGGEPAAAAPAGAAPAGAAPAAAGQPTAPAAPPPSAPAAAASAQAPPPWEAPPPPDYPSPSPRTQRGPVLFWVTLALMAIALGTLGLFDVAAAPVVDAAYAALALAVVAVMLIVGAWYGRPGGLIALGVAASLTLGALALGEPGYDGAGGQTFTPSRAGEVAARYQLPAGTMHLDLSELEDPENLDGRSIDLTANAGELRVTLPAGVDADVNAEIAAAGGIDIAGDRTGGAGVELRRTLDGGADAPRLELDLRLLVGSIEVIQP